MYALVDCNNFYASCERVFQPQLVGKPIVILSNNDGCIISRSDEAKALGIPMGAPEFKVRQELKEKMNRRGLIMDIKELFDYAEFADTGIVLCRL